MQIYALGFVSVYDQILDGLPTEERASIFKAYLGALGDDAAKFRSDAEMMEQQAQGLGSAEGLSPSDSGNELQKALAQVGTASLIQVSQECLLVVGAQLRL